MALNQRRRHWRKFDPIEPVEEETVDEEAEVVSTVTSTPASRKAELRCLQLQRLERNLSHRQGQQPHEAPKAADRTERAEDTAPGKSRASMLWAKAGKRIVAARTFASHVGHYSCNPCSMQCPHCEVPVLLAGLDFHTLACKKLTEKRLAVTEGDMVQTVRSVFPLSGSLLDSYLW